MKKPRKAPRWGVVAAAIAHCQCGWRSGGHMSKGCFREAHGELFLHRQRCPQGGKVREDYLARNVPQV